MKTLIPNTQQMSEKELRKQLNKTLLIIAAIVGSLVILVVFFTPLIGSFFGLISVNRNTPLNQDKQAPEPPIIYEFPEATKESTASIKGYAEPSSTIKLFVNGPEVASTVADATGQFNFTDVHLINGKNTIFCKATDLANNQSQNSQSVYIEVDTNKPDITIDSPKDKSVVRNLDQRVIIKGKLSEKATIKINEKFVIVKPDLTFEFTLGVKEGSNEIKFEAVDKAGNKREEKITVQYQKG